jgi:hypothetical protein
MEPIKKYEYPDLINPKEEDQKLDLFLTEELEKIEKERRESLAEKGYADFLKLEIGETKLTLQPAIPRLITGGGFGDRRAFRVTLKDQEYDWPVNPRSPMYRQMLELLKKAPIQISVIRVGEGKNTRYDLKI